MYLNHTINELNRLKSSFFLSYLCNSLSLSILFFLFRIVNCHFFSLSDAIFRLIITPFTLQFVHTTNANITKYCLQFMAKSNVKGHTTIYYLCTCFSFCLIVKYGTVMNRKDASDVFIIYYQFSAVTLRKYWLSSLG